MQVTRISLEPCSAVPKWDCMSMPNHEWCGRREAGRVWKSVNIDPRFRFRTDMASGRTRTLVVRDGSLRFDGEARGGASVQRLRVSNPPRQSWMQASSRPVPAR